MDHGIRQKREINPKENAGFFSVITFFFTYRLFRKGIRKELQVEDIYEVLHDLRAKRLGDKLEAEWEKEKKKHKNPSWITVMLRCYGRTYFFYGFMLLLLRTVLITVSPMYMGKLISYFSPGQTRLSKADAWFYAGMILGMNFFYSIFSNLYSFLILQLGLGVRAAFCSLVYRKALKLTATSLGQVTTGKLVTFLSKDATYFDLAVMYGNELWIGVIQIVIIGYIMFSQIGISAVIGIAFFILMIPLQFFMQNRISAYRIQSAAKTDDRLRATQETLTSVKIIKMYTWETSFSAAINAFRKYEINTLRKIYCVKAILLSFGTLGSKISFYICVMSYIYFQKHITAQKAFMVLNCYYTLGSTLTIYIPLGIVFLAEIRSALQRIKHFLMSAETANHRSTGTTIQNSMDISRISINNATVNVDGRSVLKKVSAEIRPGLTTLTGHVGSGKSAFLSLILNDISATEGSVNVEGTISYASQEPWLFPGSIKQNILFGQPFDKQRFDAVLHACCLNRDLEIIPQGDNSIIGDRGLNLSKGQQARINLARAVYKDCTIYLIDDCLSALDTHVSKHVFNECLKNLLKDKICVLVTHQVQHLQLSNSVLVLNHGTIENTDTYKEIAQSRTNLSTSHVNEFMKGVQTETGIAANESNSADVLSKLLVSQENGVYGESKQEGGVDIKIYKKFFGFGGSPLTMFGLAAVFVIAQVAISYSDILVGKWIDAEQKITDYNSKNLTNSSSYADAKRHHSVTVILYTAMIGVATVFTLTRAFCCMLFGSRATLILHKLTFGKIMAANMNFFDSHLIGNILNRFSRDLGTIDEYVPYVAFDVLRALLILIGIIYVTCNASPLLLLPTCLFMVILYFIRKFYLPTGRNLKRLEGASKSPLVGHLTASLEGLRTIRANKAQQMLQDQFDQHLDVFTSAYYMYKTTSAAFGFFVDFLSVVYVSVLMLTFLVIHTGVMAGKVGLALTQAFALVGLLQYVMRQWAELEGQMTNVERVLEYTSAEAEKVSGKRPKNWPSEGRIVYNNVRLTYCNSTLPVLKNLSFVVEPYDKVGIVGRTGAGKSSIISALFRLYDVEGSIIIDNENIKDLAINAVRSRISIIPQDPILFSGTIRDNLDPYQNHSDTELWKVIEEVKLKQIISDLQFNITEGGPTFSVGQKQLICLARTIIQKNKILILDEATASVDPKTDALVQNVVKEKFAGSTVLTIAHRLSTVLNSDKVMVIDNGSLIEYDTPQMLLKNREGAFYSMVHQAELT